MGWVVNTTSRPFYPRERPGTHCIGSWVGPRAGPDGCGKSRLRPGFDPRTIQPVASRYTDWAIPALRSAIYIYIYILRRRKKSLIFVGRHKEMRTLDVDWKIIKTAAVVEKWRLVECGWMSNLQCNSSVWGLAAVNLYVLLFVMNNKLNWRIEHRIEVVKSRVL